MILAILLTLSVESAWSQFHTAQTLIQSRRNYPGGRDDSNLEVQVLPQLTKKDYDIPIEGDEGDFETEESGPTE